MKNMEPTEAVEKEKGTGRQARNQPPKYVELKDDPMYPKLIEKIARTAGTILGEDKLNAFIFSQSTKSLNSSFFIKCLLKIFHKNLLRA